LAFDAVLHGPVRLGQSELAAFGSHLLPLREEAAVDDVAARLRRPGDHSGAEILVPSTLPVFERLLVAAGEPENALLVLDSLVGDADLALGQEVRTGGFRPVHGAFGERLVGTVRVLQLLLRADRFAG